MFQSKQIAGMIAIQALMLLGAATAWAGRGDIDPNYGIGGKLELGLGGLVLGPGGLLKLPDDRLIIVDPANEGEFKVRVVDGEGRDDPKFGDGGYVTILTPAATPSFLPNAAALGPNGEFLIQGTLWAVGQARFFEAILHLDAAGQPDTSFGGQGDAFYRLTDTPIEYSPDWKTTVAAFGADPSGRIVIARHGWTPENVCGGPMTVQRLLASGESDTEFGTAGQVEIPGVDLCFGAALFGVRSDSSIVVGDGRNIVAVNATGANDIGFGADGNLSSGIPIWTRGFVLPDGGLLVFSPGEESNDAAIDILTKFDRNGQVDTTYGSGTGSAIVDFGEAFTRMPDTHSLVESLLIAPDALHLYASLRILRTDGSIVCRGIARLSMDGAADAGFGNHGLTCLDYGSVPFGLLFVQTDGAPVLALDGYNVLYRLLPDSKPSPGILTVVKGAPGSNWTDESEGRISVSVMRVAGRDGAVSADYRTASTHFPRRYPYPDNAVAGADYVATSGRLDWASGEDGERAATVTILDDHVLESNEAFALEISEVEGGALFIGGSTWVGIRNDDPASNSDSESDSTSGSGGGGSTSWATLIALLALSRLCRWFDCSVDSKWQALANCVRRLTASLGLTLLGIASAWAGRGDIDPNYGEGGRVSIAPSVLLALPGDRLVIADAATEEGFRVRMVDATGRNVPAFGEGGVVRIESSDVAGTFVPETVALAPNGDMIFVGTLSGTGARVLFRLDNDGQPVDSFGNRGDGFAEPALITAPLMASDPDGKIFLAEGSWDPDGNYCGSPARLQRLLADGQPDVGFGADGIIEIPNLDICNGASVFGARADGGVIIGDGHTIVAVDAAGDIDPTFGVDGRLAFSELIGVSGLLLPDGGLLIFRSSAILKFDRNGRPDLDFGSGTGFVNLHLGADSLGVPSARENVQQLALDPDGEHVIAQLQLGVSGRDGYGRLLCSGIARLSIDGTPDAGFGRNGLTCLTQHFTLIAVQSDGAPLLFQELDESIHRLLPDDSPSPGFLAVLPWGGSFAIGESEVTATIAIERLAGRDGAVSIDYATINRPAHHLHNPYGVPNANSGSDYTATSGRLDWASGDDSQRTVTVSIVNDNIYEFPEIFGVDFSEPGGGVQLIAADSSIRINDDDDGTAAIPSPRPSGGGGSVSWATHLALLTLLFVRRRRIWRDVARIAALPGLLLLVSAAAWAGRGDIDPNYGVGGRVSTIPGVMLALPGDRLVIADAATEEGFRVRMFDATGRNVPAFGAGGAVPMDSSTAGTFVPETVALAPNGDMIFVGTLSGTGARVLLRLDNDGQPELSFGSRGDGFAEFAVATGPATGFAVDPDGKIVLAEGSWLTDRSWCGSTARLHRLLANGQPDAVFGDDGIIEIPNLDICYGAFVFGVRADGSVVVGDGHTIIAVDAAGDIDPTFGVDGRLMVSEFNEVSGLLLPDASLLIVGSDTLTGSSNTVLLKFDRNGQPDLDFGDGTGSVTVDFGAALEQPSARETVRQLAFSPDGEYVAAQLSLGVSSGTGFGRELCSGIARLTIDGIPDPNFGHNGVTCLNVNFALIGVQSDGAPLFLAGDWSDSIHRLLPDSSPSPGFLRLVATSVEVGESAGQATVAIERLAGRDGAVSANFATVDRQVNRTCYRGYDRYSCPMARATAGSDYTATSGRLDWASGDDSQHTVVVSILNDDIAENIETFGVDVSELGGGVLLIAENPTVFIDDDGDTSTAPTSPPPPPTSGGGGPPTTSGGGGSISWATHLALLTLLFVRRRRMRRAD